MKKINRLNLLFFGSAILTFVLGLVFIGVGGQINSLTCIRLEAGRVDCELQRKFFGLIPTSRQALLQVSASEVKEDCSDGCRYWVEILAGDQTVRLTRFSSYNRQGVTADQEQIMQFLGNPALQSFELTGSFSWVLLVSSVPLIIAGGILAIFYGKRIFEA